MIPAQVPVPSRLAQSACTALLLALSSGLQAASPPDPVFVDQGEQWTEDQRLGYYSQDQGAQIMPLTWMQALTYEGRPFMDRLAGYGYLANPHSDPAGLPVGFTTNDGHVGMTCAACHTREIRVDGTAYRIDGGPAMTDFQALMVDLDAAVGALLDDEAAFAQFASRVDGGEPSAIETQSLKLAVQAWYLRFHTLMSKALPADHPWGPGRLDAVGMIFNRLSGLDIGTGHSGIIADNIQVADAPVRYPFLWNASIQDKTQWPGFADNGNAILALSRNLGEVYGVFADFRPVKDQWRILGIDYLQTNSANFRGLKDLEKYIERIGPPKWPWTEGPHAIDEALAARGKAIYESPTATEHGGCIGCHGIQVNTRNALIPNTWKTPLCDVGSDTREYQVLSWEVDTGVLDGASIPFLEEPLKPRDKAVSVLGTAVIGSILQHAAPVVMGIEIKAKEHAEGIQRVFGKEGTELVQGLVEKLQRLQSRLVDDQTKYLRGAFQQIKGQWQDDAQAGSGNCKWSFSDPEPVVVYESRVMEGIWASAPYLHNGSVPTLAYLLEPADKRPVSFVVGPAYDPAKVGLATEQTAFDFTYQTTGCDDRNSGNSRCGHEYGTRLPDEDKRALLEYLKTL